VRIGSLFSGIGGLELGLERAGLGHVMWQVEINPFCRSVLARHWPDVPRYEDVASVGVSDLSPVDLICGGFPCQDVSSAGARAGLAGAKSGLWYEYRRIVGELRPRFVVVENVTSGKKLWLPTVRGDLGALGYRVRALALSAVDVGAPHLRRRVFVVATTDPDGIVLREQPGRRQRQGDRGSRGNSAALANARHDGISRTLGDSDSDSESALAIDGEVAGVRGLASRASPWASPPVFRGMVDGVSGRMDRLRALGNAVVPQCAEVIGRIIAEHIEHQVP